MRKLSNLAAFIFLMILSLESISQTLTFSSQRGFYNSTFQLTISKSFSGGAIRYTTDGTAPTTASGTVYSGSITINTTSVIRAIGYNGATVTPVTTHTYLFLNDVIHQPANIAGWPNNLYDLGTGGVDAVHDYEMDPDVVNNSSYSGQIVNGLRSIPTLSIVMDKDDFWEVYDGDEAEGNEQPTSVELLFADKPSDNEQFNCGLEAHSHLRLKRSLRLALNNNYFPSLTSYIFKNAPVNASTATNHFDHTKIVLRGGNNRSWARNWNPDRTCYTRDEWYRESQIAVSGIGAHGIFVHLYVNGLYWGLYDAVERPDAGFEREYMGGSYDDWMSMYHDGIRSGDAARFNYLNNTLSNKDMSVTNNYNELKQYLDINKYSEYIIVSWIAGMADWPGFNFYGGNRNVPAGSQMYYGWDGERSWDNMQGSSNGAWVHPDMRSNDSGGALIAKLWLAAKNNAEFLMNFADLVYKHCFNNGALTDNASRARWQALNNFISTAIIAESARWGDAVDSGTPRTKNGHWQPEVNRVDALMNGNAQRFLTALRAEGYYPTINPPNFNQEGGTFSSSFNLTMSNPNGSGTIYYTTNGTDPREAGGAIAGGAQTYSSGITINSATIVKARVRSGTTWSALHEGTYIINGGSPFTSVFINEFVASNMTGIVDEVGEFEDWIEIYNHGNSPVDIGGLYITDNFTNLTKYQIPTSNPALTTIPAKGYKVLWADEDLDQGILHVDIKLSKSGEMIGLVQLIGGNPVFVDSVFFGAQTDNVSTGRYPNGTGNFTSLTTTTPGSSNVLTGGTPDCNGVINGTASIDNCGICSGGNTGIITNSTCAPSSCVQNEVVSFTLMKEGTAGEIGPLTNGTVINLATIGNFSIRANVCSTSVGSVKFILNGKTERTETTLPYAINGDSPVGNYSAWKPSVGSYTLIGRPYIGSNGSGSSGVEETVIFTVINQTNVNDCNGTPNGTAAVDDCGVCAGGTTGIVPNANKDQCGVCNGSNAAKDCNGVCFGTATIDGCGNCVGGNTGLTACSADCNGVLNGAALIDNCGVCSGGNTGITPNSTCTPSSCVQNEVVSFTIMKEGTAGEIGPLTNGIVINLATIGNFSIRANICSTTVGSVKFILNGVTKRTETDPPYAINGDSPSGSYTKWTPSVGSYTLIGKPYTGANGSGTSGVQETVTFTVVNQANTTDCNGVLNGSAHLNSCNICVGGNTGKAENFGKDCNGVCGGLATLNSCNVCSGGNTGLGANAGKDCNNVCNGSAAIDNCGVCAGGNTGITPNSGCSPSCVQNEVISFTLVKKGTTGDIGPLTNGMVINLSTIGEFSIRANVCSTPVGSVKFIVNGVVKKTETDPPYAINGDSPVGSYTAWKPSAGTYTFTGKPYTGANGNGTSGVEETVTFTVINSGSSKTSLENDIEEENQSYNFELYPNPSNGIFHVRLKMEETGDVLIRIFNPIGQTVYSSFSNNQMDEYSQTIELDNSPTGIYFFELTVNGISIRKKIAVRN